MCAFLAQHFYQLLRWKTTLYIVMNLEYNICMTVLMDNTSSSITLLNFSLADDVTYSHPCLTSCNSLAMRSFYAIKNQKIEMVALTYSLVALANVFGCLCTSDMTTHSSNYAGDVWMSGVHTLCNYITMCCDSSKSMLCISASGLSSRMSVSP